ncbi:hypothetical protein TNCV_5022821 [Trichonephila clavipes]|nr:hypothetical protein TNCV_5022821 [Trichonephila clavipes]
MNWSTIEREACAVLSALKKFDCWIFRSQIQVVSDHNPLTFLTKGLPHGTKLARWALALQRYDLWIIYRIVNENPKSDSTNFRNFAGIMSDDPNASFQGLNLQDHSREPKVVSGCVQGWKTRI